MDQVKACPSCQREIPATAVRCRHCGEYGDSGVRATSGSSAEVKGVMPPPPGLHWGFVLLASVLTCGLFMPIWLAVQGFWARRAEPASNVLPPLALYAGTILVTGVIVAMGAEALAPIAQVLGLAFYLAAAFRMKDTIEACAAGREMRLSLSGFLTFLLSSVYLQYQLNEMSRFMKKP